MKRTLLFLSITFFTTAIYAQKYDDIKNSIMLGQIDKAKEALDKNSANEKFFNKPEGYLAKAAVYASLSVDSSKAAQADQNRSEANTAFQKYKELDPSMKLLEDPTYKNVPFNLYASYFNSGVADINTKAFEPAYEKFKQTVDYSDLLISKKIMNKQMDTAAIYYAGLLAENTKKPDEALKYYTRLSDAKVTEFNGTKYNSVYEGLVRYYASKTDNANFEKYKALGKELFPDSEFFTYSMAEFAVGSGGNLDEKVANLEKMVAANPTDYKTNIMLAEVIYAVIDTKKEGATMPANAAELETKMIKALDAAVAANPNELQPLLLLGDHYTNKSEKVKNDKAKYEQTYGLAKTNYEKAAALFAKLSALDATQKRQYRIIAGNLANYYAYKKDAANEKKYGDLFDKLR